MASRKSTTNNTATTTRNTTNNHSGVVVVGFFTRLAIGVALLLVFVVVVGGGRRSDDDAAAHRRLQHHHRVVVGLRGDSNDRGRGDNEEEQENKFNALYIGGRGDARPNRFDTKELASMIAYLEAAAAAAADRDRKLNPVDVRLVGKRAPTACINNCLDRAVSFVRCRSICH